MNAPFNPNSVNRKLSRRNFIVAGMTAAGGLAIGVTALSPAARAASVAPAPWDTDPTDPHDIDAWIAIQPDDSIMIRYVRAEMGQGSMTALPMILVEELQCDWSKVSIQYASANRNFREKNVYGDMSSVGSHSIRGSHEKMQQVGASARVRLIAAAATRWNVPASECASANSVVTHTPSGRTARYGELASDAALIKLDKEPAIKKPADYTFIGKPRQRVDVPPKVNGSAKFAIDTRLPDMVYAAIMACPVPGGKLKSVDASPLAGSPGIVKVVQLPNAVAVVATNFWRAKQGLAKLQPEWDVGAAGSTTSAQFDKEYRDAAASAAAVTARNDGDFDKALSGAAKKLDVVYEAPLLAHAPMEPMNSTVYIQPDRMDIWVGTQAADKALTNAAKQAGMKPEQVYIHDCFVGGGFGRKSNNDDMLQAIQVAQQVGKPVKLIWTREEDMRQDRYRPQAAVRMQAGIGADNMPTALSARAAAGSILRSLGASTPDKDKGLEAMAVDGLATHPYKIANTYVGCILKNTHIPVAFWRSVGPSQNGFIIESFVDEMAHAGGIDPYKFRRALLEGKPEWLAVLDTVAKEGEWGKAMPAGSAQGMAIFSTCDSIAAHVAEVSVSAKGEIKVNKVTVAIDVGVAVNPLTIAEQVEGSVIFGLSAALYGKITIKDGAAEQGNFDTYRMVRFAQAPKIDTHILASGKIWGGVGEPAVPGVAAAVGNAVFSITGKRLRSLPFMDHDLTGSA